MTQEDKQLVLVDLCARLPYNIRGEVGACKNCIIYPHDIEDFKRDERNIKPYLRPMSSMTEEELAEYTHLIVNGGIGTTAHFDWLNRKMFDYRDLIPKGSALKAPEGMYKMEEQQ